MLVYEKNEYATLTYKIILVPNTTREPSNSKIVIRCYNGSKNFG